MAASARDLVPMIEAHKSYSEERRALHPEVVDGCVQAGLFRLLTPWSWARSRSTAPTRGPDVHDPDRRARDRTARSGPPVSTRSTPPDGAAHRPEHVTGLNTSSSSTSVPSEMSSNA